MKEQDAIELLKGMQNPLEDYADMVCAPEWATGYRYVYQDPEDYAIEEAITALEERRNRKWIPASERLPDEPKEGQGIKEYIVTIDGAFESTTLSYLGRDQWRDDDGNWYKVLAWMPKPEPYKPELSRLMGAGERGRYV
ncbi:MAG: DUF551 domain-containing protein [Faecalicatena sp.]|uniref:hypothetical protein n=1 Tax=Faecalicatena sp. TaxID=2005360 RepID=UPI002590589D|nr:hypothetical protein [Faecalicatena sp.]MCI6464741.1 DUF551 domain-containing protein [Faecalicatena sp.]MDY5618318.1 hypothetical protein [Lachnospiraceae bacterium]